MNNQCEKNDPGSSVAEGVTTSSNDIHVTAPSSAQGVEGSSNENGVKSTVDLLNDDDSNVGDSKDVVPKSEASNGSGPTVVVPAEDSNVGESKDVVPKSDEPNASEAKLLVLNDNESDVGGSKDDVPNTDASDGDVPKTGDSRTSGSESGDAKARKTTAKSRNENRVRRRPQSEDENYNPNSQPPPAKRARRDLPPGAIEQVLKSVASKSAAQGETDVNRGAEVKVDNRENAPQTEVDQREGEEVVEGQEERD
ncbi:trans-Golgi network integral membrane protein 2-like [Drosophila eugracilis]|uniref:trans-Golgi network integral membrane protein 2-like n=1 Tax=Drosophila eugracilis TaxID=29029 RepID=UPI0007E6C77E|nr:trans-Golgi network integral membrane protein 2-like [Drosophila eugracilis]